MGTTARGRPEETWKGEELSIRWRSPSVFVLQSAWEAGHRMCDYLGGDLVMVEKARDFLCM